MNALKCFARLAVLALVVVTTGCGYSMRRYDVQSYGDFQDADSFAARYDEMRSRGPSGQTVATAKNVDGQVDVNAIKLAVLQREQELLEPLDAVVARMNQLLNVDTYDDKNEQLSDSEKSILKDVGSALTDARDDLNDAIAEDDVQDQFGELQSSLVHAHELVGLLKRYLGQRMEFAEIRETVGDDLSGIGAEIQLMLADVNDVRTFFGWDVIEEEGRFVNRVLTKVHVRNRQTVVVGSSRFGRTYVCDGAPVHGKSVNVGVFLSRYGCGRSGGGLGVNVNTFKDANGERHTSVNLGGLASWGD